MITNAPRRVRVEELERVANRIKRFAFVPIDGLPLPLFSAGAHVIVTMRDGNRVWRNPYSLMGSPLDSSCYQISVLRVDETRGGSAYMHERVLKGSTLEINEPVNLFPVDWTGRKHILIAGDGAFHAEQLTAIEEVECDGAMSLLTGGADAE